jgi:hypothetical protein
MAKAFNAKWNKNEKLAKTSGEVYNIVGFGLPADTDFVVDGVKLNTCPGALACRPVCYAKQGGYRFRNSIAARQHNLAFSQTDRFVFDVIADLKRMRKVNTVRIHDSGDFYSQEYFDKWCAIAYALPNIAFYAYTKSLHLNLADNIPANLRIVQSLGGKHDKLVNLNRSHSRIFANHEARVAAGYVDGNIDDSPAIQGLVQIGLVYHGNKNLTEGQEKYFG